MQDRIVVGTMIIMLLLNIFAFVVRTSAVNSELPRVASGRGLEDALTSAKAIGASSATHPVSELPTESYLTMHTASGQTLSVPKSLAGPQLLSMFTLNQTSTLFLNDERGGDKVDILLKNYTMLSQDYLQGDIVRVIALMGSRLSSDLYEIHSPGGLEVDQLSQRLQEFGGEILSTYVSLPFVTVELPYAKLAELAESDNVAHVFLDKKYTVQIAESVPIIKPPAIWQQIETQFGLAINGSGVKIAILDTGIDKNHPDLNDLDDNPATNDPKVIDERCFTGEGHVWDGYGHGTHCASIAAGTGEASNHTRVGVAPAAWLLNGKVLTDSGSGYDSWIISGIEWAVSESANVLSMSFGSDVNGDGSDPLSMAIDWATDQGSVCTVAAGNAGVGGMFTAGTPAGSKKAICVGATAKNDTVAYFSSQGPTSDYRLKPDVCAPGVDIVAARANGTSMGSVVDAYYTKASGTSMATPHVAGAAALIKQAHRDWNPTMIKSSLMGSAKLLSGEDLWREGAGRIDCCKSTNATLLVVEPSASFGILKLGDVANTALTIMNLANMSSAVTISNLAFCEGQAVNYVDSNASSIVMPGHSNATVALHVGPIDSLAPEGWYEGWINATYGAGLSIKAPFLFAVLSEIIVSVYDVDNSTPIDASIVLAYYPNMTFVDYRSASWTWENPSASWVYKSAHFLSKTGNYSLCAQMAWIKNGGSFNFARMFMLQKSVSVPKASSVNVSMSLADARVSYIPTIDSCGRNLIVHSFTQYFCGGPQTWNDGYFQQSQWSTGANWAGLDLNVSQLTFYSTDYTPSDRLCEALGYYASDTLLSEVYLMPLKYWNVLSLPSILSYPESDLAKYHVFYNMPETYPENGLKINNGFWFTWDHIGSGQGWGWDVHRVPAGINATYYLAPQHGTYWGEYMSQYSGWNDSIRCPTEEWKIGQHYPYPQIPPQKGETGNIVLGQYSFAPYQPGLSLNISGTSNTFLANLTGDLWKNLSWPNLEGRVAFGVYPVSFYPQYYAEYQLYVNRTLYDEGELNGNKGYGGTPYVNYPPEYLDVDWRGISKSWNLSRSDVLLQLSLPSLGNISKHTTYNMSFTLGSGDSTPPMLTGVYYPLNYTPSQDLKTNFTATDTGLGIASHFLKYSFDNGITWQSAAYQNPNYVIHCIEADSLAILINVTDKAGNSLQYLSNPASLCNKVRLEAPQNVVADGPGASVSIHGNLTSIEGIGLGGIAVSLSNGKTIYTTPDENGRFVFDFSAPGFPENHTYAIGSPTVGLYGSEEVHTEVQMYLTLPKILVVNDDDGTHSFHGTSLPEFESALNLSGYDYWVWNESSLGNPPLSFLTKFRLVIWTTGDYWSKTVDPVDAATLESYINHGGSILLEGEDIGLEHNTDSFMINVAHAIYQVDKTGASGFTVTKPNHPVAQGLPSSFTWATTPHYDDGVAPTNTGMEVVHYVGTNWTAVTIFEGTISKVVYYAFPLYCLWNSEQRTLALNSVNWLLSFPSRLGWLGERTVCEDSFSVSESNPSIATDSNGYLYAAYEHFDNNSGLYGICVSKSMDRGTTWSRIYTLSGSNNLQHPSIAIDIGDNDNIFVAFEREWTTNDHDIFVLRYTGGNWAVSAVANVLGNDDRYPSIASEYQYGAADRQYISYEYVYSYDDRDLMFAKSIDDGATWSLQKLYGSWPDSNVHCQTSITTTRGSDGNDMIYIAYKWGADYNTAYDIILVKSKNRGATWTQQWVCDESSRDKNWPSIISTRGGGAVVIAWHVYYDSAYLNDIQYAYSVDNGNLWSQGWLASDWGADERSPVLTVDGQDSTSPYTSGSIRVAYWRDNAIYYRQADFSSPWSWSAAERVTDASTYVSSVYTKPAITVYRSVNGRYLPAVAWTKLISSGYNVCYSTKGVLPQNSSLLLNAGWNMVSFPVMPTNTSFASIFNGKGYYQVLTWSGTSYVTPTNAEAGRGYWVLMLSATTVNVTGMPVENYELDLTAGWSMIGSIYNSTVDADTVFPDYYQLLTWSGTSYVPATTIEPGKGYWALVLEPTHIIVG